MELKAVSEASETSTIFFLTVENSCITLIPQQETSFDTTLYDVVIFDTVTLDVPFNPLIENFGCGEPTYKLIDQDTGFEFDTNLYFIDVSDPNNPFITFLFDDPAIHTGTYQVYIETNLNNFQTFETSVVTINVLNPCYTTIIDGQPLANMFTTVSRGDPEIQTFEIFTDSESARLGSAQGFELCGEFQEYTLEIIDPVVAFNDFLTFDPLTRTITVETQDPAFIGTYTFRLTVTHTKFGSQSIFEDFDVTIGECVVLSLDTLATPSITYNVD
jgi:hypothetical protein